MSGIDLLPLPEQEHNELLSAVRDILHNGERIPQDVSDQLLLAAIIELNGGLARTSNQTRRNTLAMRLLTGGMLLIAAVILGIHGDEMPLVASIFGIFTP